MLICELTTRPKKVVNYCWGTRPKRGFMSFQRRCKVCGELYRTKHKYSLKCQSCRTWKVKYDGE